jgi:chorismate dehydratase
VRIGSVPYLNARPLVAWLESSPQPGVELIYDVPSSLIRRLQADELDVAMASVYALIDDPSLVMLSGLGVSSTGPAWSVRLLSRAPVADVRTVALDAASRSSTALARIILRDLYGVTPTCVELPADRDTMLAEADAAVLIGDIGLAVSGEGLIDVDLGEAWHTLTGLPFLFAGWLARDMGALAAAEPVLRQARAHGAAHLAEIAVSESIRLGLPYARCHAYLSQVMRYDLGEAEMAGFAEFRRRVGM